jgi:hypothetical protein
MKKIRQRLLSFYDIRDPADTHYERRAFEMIKETKRG